MDERTVYTKLCTNCNKEFKTLRTRKRVCEKCKAEAQWARFQRTQRAQHIPSLTVEEFTSAVENRERWFNNGSSQERYVTSINGFFVFFKSKPSSRKSTGVPMLNFLKWAKGVGRLPEKKKPKEDNNIEEKN